MKYNRETGQLEWNEGYRYEDLTNENKNIIDWCNYLIDAGQLEIAIKVIDDLKEYLKATLDGYQVSLIENQEGE